MPSTIEFQRPIANPLAGRESWPSTGPIYGLAEDYLDAGDDLTFWQRWSFKPRTTVPASTGEMAAPVWY